MLFPFNLLIVDVLVTKQFTRNNVISIHIQFWWIWFPCMMRCQPPIRMQQVGKGIFPSFFPRSLLLPLLRSLLENWNRESLKTRIELKMQSIQQKLIWMCCHLSYKILHMKSFWDFLLIKQCSPTPYTVWFNFIGWLC